MNDDKNDIYIDYQSILKLATDKVITELMSSLMPDDETRKLMTALIAAHRKYGIDAATSVKIIQEFAKLIEEDDANDQSAT